jgi:hypothetical protein
MRRHLKSTLACLACAAAVVGSTTSALAVTPSLKAAKTAAAAKARQLAHETHASSSRVLNCKRSNPTRYVCQIENRFSSGAQRCTAQVVVRFVSGRARTSYSNYVCF